MQGRGEGSGWLGPKLKQWCWRSSAVPAPPPRPVGIFHPAGPETGTPSLSHLRLGSKSRSQHLMSDGISL